MMMHEHFPAVSSLMAEVMCVKLVSCRWKINPAQNNSRFNDTMIASSA